MKMRKIMVMGCGGVGSWLCRLIAFGIDTDAIRDAEFTLYDNDRVSEKNLLYSDFEPFDLGMKKAEALGKRHHLERFCRRACAGDARYYDLVLCTVDNAKSRRELAGAGVRFIDMRAKGRAAVAMAVEPGDAESVERFLKSLAAPESILEGEADETGEAGEAEEQGESCQYEHSIGSMSMEAGNVIAAALGYQMLLNWLRRERSHDMIIYV